MRLVCQLIGLFTGLVLLVPVTGAEPPKVLVLIIASDNQPVYADLQRLWRQYMHLDPAHITAYFIKADPKLPQPFVIQSDVIWSRTKEDLRPGILNKTILSLAALGPKLGEFDYVLRTNLSSLYVFPRLLQFLRTCPQQRFYCASGDPERNLGSGSGFLLSIDVAQLLIKHSRRLLNRSDDADDVLIGRFLAKQQIKLVLHHRQDIYSLADYAQVQNAADTVFQFRVKNWTAQWRATQDVMIYQDLVQKFYPVAQFSA